MTKIQWTIEFLDGDEVEGQDTADSLQQLVQDYSEEINEMINPHTPMHWQDTTIRITCNSSSEEFLITEPQDAIYLLQIAPITTTKNLISNK
tara:strand:+ start:1838 stop:2113 length:276 start_codon:yes stop_codon:yes gene_type:complete